MFPFICFSILQTIWVCTSLASFWRLSRATIRSYLWIWSLLWYLPSINSSANNQSMWSLKQCKICPQRRCSPRNFCCCSIERVSSVWQQQLGTVKRWQHSLLVSLHIYSRRDYFMICLKFNTNAIPPTPKGIALAGGMQSNWHLRWSRWFGA